MTLAGVSDVRRYLTQTMTDAQLTPAIEAASQFVRWISGRDFDADGEQTQEFGPVRQRDDLTLRDLYPTVTKVEGFILPPPSTGRSLSSFEWTTAAFGRVRLLYAPFGAVNPLVSPIGVQVTSPPYDIKTALMMIDRPAETRYDHVIVTYNPSGIVPQPVTEAVGIIAAELLTATKIEMGRMKMEQMGEYRYELSEKTPIISPRAMILLQPFVGETRNWPAGAPRPPVGQMIW